MRRRTQRVRRVVPKLVEKTVEPMAHLDYLPEAPPNAKTPEPAERQVKLVDWNEWRECYVRWEEEESVRRYGRTTVPSSAGSVIDSQLQPALPSEILPAPESGPMKIRDRNRLQKKKRSKTET